MGHKNRDSYMNLFKHLEILTPTSQYIFSLLLFLVSNRDFFMRNSQNHNINARQSNDFHMPLANLTVYQQGVHYSGIKLFNKLAQEIKNITGNLNKFKQALRKFLNTYSFYTLEEFCNTYYTMYKLQ